MIRSLGVMLLFFMSYLAFSQNGDGFIIASNFGLGSGSSSFSYDIVEQAPGNTNSDVVRREFSTDLFDLKLNLSLGYRYKNVGAGVSLITSTQKSTEVKRTSFRDNGTTLPSKNGEDWPNGKSYYGLFLDYNLKLSDEIFFVPRLDFLKYSYPDNGAFISAGTFVENTSSYNETFVDRTALGFTGQLSFVVSENQSFTFGLRYMQNYFDVSRDYLQETISNFESSQNSFNVTIGYGFNF